MKKIVEIEEVRTGLYNIYREYLLKHISKDQACRDIISYLSDVNDYSNVDYTKHMNSLLMRLAVKLLLKINPKSPLFYKFLEENIIDNSITGNTRFYLYNVISEHFQDRLESLQDFILRFLPSYFPNNIEFDGVEIIKANLCEFLFLTHNILNKYFPNQSNNNWKWNHNFKGFSNNNILILKDNDPFINEKFPVQYSYDTHNNWQKNIRNGKQYLILEKKYSIQLLYIGFAIQIFKLLEKDFEDSRLEFSFPSDPETIPTKVVYKGSSNILLYFFEEPIISPQPKEIKKIKNRTDAIDFNPKRTYIK